ncbi:MAG: Flagellar biosynthesis protein FlhB, partial [uncultured Solirubrobacteraceae bacterium]
GERQDREGNTQEARRRAQEGAGRPLRGPQRVRRPARLAARLLRPRALHLGQDDGGDPQDPRARVLALRRRDGGHRRAAHRGRNLAHAGDPPHLDGLPRRGHRHLGRPGRLQAVPRGAEGRPQADEPHLGREEPLRHADGLRVGQERRQGRRGRRDRGARGVPEARGDRLRGRHAAGPAARRDVLDRARRLPEGGDRLPVHRDRRLHVAEVRFREEEPDGGQGGQGRVQAAGRPGRGQERPAPPRHAGRQRPHDGRRPDRRRGRHEPDPLRGRAEVRLGPARPDLRRQGPGPPGAPDARRRRSRGRDGGRGAAARAVAARVRRGRPDDPGGALPGRRGAAGLRVPDRGGSAGGV